MYTLLVLLAPAYAQYDIVVAKDGSGNYTTVQAAVNASPTNSSSRTEIYIKNGTYFEVITVPSNKTNLTFIGQSITGTVLTYDNAANKINPATVSPMELPIRPAALSMAPVLLIVFLTKNVRSRQQFSSSTVLLGKQSLGYMKKIIVATDYSAEAENAADFAGAVAAEQGHELVLFNYSEISIHVLNARVSGSAIDEILEIYHANLNKAAQALSKKYNVKVTPHLASGNFYESLVDCINQFEAIAVVMGMANRSVEQDLLGNTTTSAIHKLQFPILAIPITTKYHGIRKILFACDMEKGVEEKVLATVQEIATAYGATVEVVYVNDKIESLQGAEEAELASIDKTFTGINYYYKNIQSRKIVDAILDEIKETQADLLIMAPYQYGFWDSMVHRSKTRMMASGNNVPLLSLPS